MATIDLGKISFTQKGTWASGTAYVAKDVVQYTDDNETSSYVAIASSTGQAPATNGTVNSSNWALFAKGASIASNYQSSAWASGTAYQKGDVVQYTDSGIVSTYLAIVDSTGETPSTSGSINASKWAYLAKGTASAGTAWDSTPKTANFTAVGGNGYWCNTSGGAFTVTLPAGSNGLTVELVDSGGAFATNNLTLTPNGSEKIDGVAGNRLLGTNRQGVRLVYSDATTGWTSPTGNANDSKVFYVQPYNIDYVLVAGGGGGGDSNSGGGGAGGMLTGNTVQVNGGETLSITVGSGGASVNNSNGTIGTNSTLSGAGLTTQTANGGGYGATGSSTGGNGGSGGGNGYVQQGSGGIGTSGQGNNGGSGAGSNGPSYGGGGGGGKGSAGTNGTANAGGNGGSGLATSITGSSITLAGGGGGSTDNSNNAAGAGGSGGGGHGRKDSRTGIDGTAETGGGGGACHNAASPHAGSGGSGVVYIRIPTASYTGTITGSPTVTTDGSHKVLKYTGTGTYTT